ncbi:MAG: YicC family protein, partial [Bacteroidales bacterium]|nr:YicC family protein [Bacteroidales bacterium]
KHKLVVFNKRIMLKSMTGFGRTACELDSKNVTIEIKSLNSKQADVYSRLPNAFKEKELEIRNLVIQELNRGKIEVTITVETTNSAQAALLNEPVIKEYHRQLLALSNDLGTPDDDILQLIMRMPESLVAPKDELEDKEWECIRANISEALVMVDNFRKREGSALQKDIAERVDMIQDLLQQISPYEKERINSVRERINKSLNEFIEVDKIDTNRFEQELIYYLEKIDITEEVVRLNNHCKFFTEVIASEQNAGKKLSFITQEMGREINTIGSKANNSDIQRLVVLMKDELEKIKEQLMNVL